MMTIIRPVVLYVWGMNFLMKDDVVVANDYVFPHYLISRGHKSGYKSVSEEKMDKILRASQKYQYTRERYQRTIVYHPVSFANQTKPGTYPRSNGVHISS